MKRTNQILLVVLLVLLSAFVLTRVFRSPALESTLDTKAFRIDTTDISLIVIDKPDPAGPEIQLRKKDMGWAVEQGSQTAAVQMPEFKSLLRTITGFKPERVVSRKKEKWNNYDVSDSTAIRVRVYDQAGDAVAEWLVGKESGGLTYMRPGGESDTYAVRGNLRARFDNTFNDWRDRTFLNIESSLISKMTFDYPADSGFVLQKDGSHWMIGGQEADSAKVARYLSKIKFKELNAFADHTPSGDAQFALMVDSDSQPRTVVSAWKNAGRQWILTSTSQKDVFFTDSSFAGDLFPASEWFIGSDRAEK